MKCRLFFLVLLTASMLSADDAVHRSDCAYGPRQVGAGAAHKDSAQTYDVYLPAPVGEIPSDAPIYLFVHGGAWMAGSKADAWPLLNELSKHGYVGISMNYALCPPGATDVTFATMLKDIDAMVSLLPELCKELKLKTPKKIILGGKSAGGHLALLYAYDAAQPSILKLGLKHSVSIGCVVSDCGPTDLTSEAFKTAAHQGQPGDRNRQRAWFSVLSGGRATETNDQRIRRQLARYSPAAFVSAKVPPTLALYGESGKVPGTEIATDGIIARQNYDTLTNRLTQCKVPFAARLTPYPHCQALERDADTRLWYFNSLRALMANPVLTTRNSL